jgi:ribosomal protein S18 acetylase RimI-like enzyme
MFSQKISIRRATPDDASLIANIGARTFEASFRADNRLEDMERYLSLSFSKAHIAAQLADPSSIFLLAYEECKAVGYVMLRASKKPISVTGTKPVELVRFYVEEEIIGKGYGSALMNSCLEEAKKNGYRTIWLGVWEKNLRAIGFYEKWGFTKVGTKSFVLGSDLQNDHIMARPVEMVAQPLRIDAT